MDRDNPFGSSYLREGVTRVQKPRLTYRQAEATPMPPHNNNNTHPASPKRTQPHLRLQRRLSLTDKPPTDVDLSEGDLTKPRAAPSLRSSGSTATRRSSNPRRVVRPADHSRPTVHFTNGRSEALLTLPAVTGNVHPPAFPPTLPTAPTSTALAQRPSNGNLNGNLHRNPAVFGNNDTTPRPSFSPTMYGSTTGGLSTNHNVNNGTKRVTFDSSETEDSASCLSTSTQATSVEEHDDYYYGSGKTAASVQTQAQAQVQSQVQVQPEPVWHSLLPPRPAMVTPPQPTRRRSRSFSGIDRELLHPEAAELVHVPPRRWRESFAYVLAGEVQRGQRGRAETETQTSSVSATSTDTDKNTQAQFEAHKVALEAQYEQRQQALETEKTKLTDELQAAVTALGRAQADADNLRREASEQRQRMLLLAQENDDLKEGRDIVVREKERLVQVAEAAAEKHRARGEQERLELRADLATAKRQRDDTQALLRDAQQTLSEASLGLDDLRAELAAAQDATALVKDGKAAVAARCTELEAQVSSLEGQVVAARDANKELHLLMASQIDDLTATKGALLVRLGILEEEEAARAAATAAAVEAAKAAEDKAEAATAQSDADKKALAEKLAAADETTTALTTEKEALTAELADCKAQIETLTADIAAKTQEVDKLTADLTAKTEQVGKLTADLTAANEAQEALQTTIDGHLDALDKAREAASESATAAAPDKVDERTATITKLEADVASLTAECATLKAAAEAKTADAEAGERANAPDASPPDTALQDKITQLAAAHTELQDMHTALAAALAAEKTEKEAVANAHATAQEEAAAALNAAQEAQEQAAAHAAAAAQLPALVDRLNQLQSAYATSEAEGMALRDQLAKMRGKLAGVAASVSSSATKKSSKSTKKAELVIVRTPGDRGRFQVMRKSELHRSRSNSRCSRKTDDDSN